MGIQINHIEVPKEWESTNDWNSHRPAIFYAINNIPHSCFDEFGMGYGSTPLLAKWYGDINSLGKEFYSFETNEEWFNKFMEGYKNTLRNNSLIKGNHYITLTEDYLKWDLLKDSIVFIDSAPGEQRKGLIAKHAHTAKAIIVHDTEPGAEYVYSMADILSTFKYRLDYTPEGKPWTTIVSNSIDVSKWAE